MISKNKFPSSFKSLAVKLYLLVKVIWLWRNTTIYKQSYYSMDGKY